MHSAVELRQDEGEVLLWNGAPDAKKLLSSADVFMVPFTLFWVTMGFLFLTRWPAGAQPLGIVAVTIAGLYVVIGRLFVRTRRHKRTEYLLTNERAIITTPKGVFEFDLTSGSPHVETLGSGTHRTYRFTSDDPKTYGKASNRVLENTGLDSALKPGTDTRFSFFDVRSDGEADSAIRNLVDRGIVAEGIA